MSKSAEPPLLVFVSSVMRPELQAARDEVVRVVGRSPILTPWAFEFTPASSTAPDDTYLAKVACFADFVIWLVGELTTPPVENEVHAALETNRPLLVFKLPASSRDAATATLLEEVRPHVKWAEIADTDQLGRDVRIAIGDEIIRAVRGRHGDSRTTLLEELARESRGRCIARWLGAGVPASLAMELADDDAVGAPEHDLASARSGLFLLVGELGAGKSLLGERLFQQSIARARFWTRRPRSLSSWTREQPRVTSLRPVVLPPQDWATLASWVLWFCSIRSMTWAALARRSCSFARDRLSQRA